jgi:hypothetical protein
MAERRFIAAQLNPAGRMKVRSCLMMRTGVIPEPQTNNQASSPDVGSVKLPGHNINRGVCLVQSKDRPIDHDPDLQLLRRRAQGIRAVRGLVQEGMRTVKYYPARKKMSPVFREISMLTALR